MTNLVQKVQLVGFRAGIQTQTVWLLWLLATTPDPRLISQEACLPYLLHHPASRHVPLRAQECGLRVSFQPGILQMGYCHFPHVPSPYYSLYPEGFPERMRTLVLGCAAEVVYGPCKSLLLAEPGFPCPVRGETVASPAGVVRWKWCIAHAQRRGSSLLSVKSLFSL